MMNAMFRLLPHGDVLYSIRITMKLACDMDLSRKGILKLKYNKGDFNNSLVLLGVTPL